MALNPSNAQFESLPRFVTSYHIDNQDGLNLFASAVR